MYKKIFLIFIFTCVQTFGLCQMYFTPRDDIKSYLIQLIKEEKTSIDAAVYMFTDKSIAQALVDAYVRGVKIRLVLDQISMGARFGKGLFLQNNGISIFVHAPNNMGPFSTPIMHHKFFIFGQNMRTGTALLWTGSFNCTIAAATLNDENVIISDEQMLIQEYKKCFLVLINRLTSSTLV